MPTARLPVTVAMEAFSPFIPLNAADSGVAGHDLARSRSRTPPRPGRVTLAAGWRTPCAAMPRVLSMPAAEPGASEKVARCFTRPGDHTRSAGEAAATADRAGGFRRRQLRPWKATGEAFGGPRPWDLPDQQQVSGFLGKGLVNTFLGGDDPQGTLTSPAFKISRKDINFLIGGGITRARPASICSWTARSCGPPRARTTRNSNGPSGTSRTCRARPPASRSWIAIRRLGTHQRRPDRDGRRAAGGDLGPFDKLPDFGTLVLAGASDAGCPDSYAGRFSGPAGNCSKWLHADEDATYPATERRSAAVTTAAIELAPGAARTFTFVLAWFFPNFAQGHEYATRFRSAADVANYVLDNHARLAGDTKKWHKTYYEDSTLPRWLLYRLHSTVGNMATGTCQWWKNGRFWAWEGVGCCEGTCAHVWNYEHAMARLFPELERIRCARCRTSAPRRLRRRTAASSASASNRAYGRRRPVRHGAQGLSRAPMSADDSLPQAQLAADQEGHGIPRSSRTATTTA